MTPRQWALAIGLSLLAGVLVGTARLGWWQNLIVAAAFAVAAYALVNGVAEARRRRALEAEARRRRERIVQLIYRNDDWRFVYLNDTWPGPGPD